MGVISLGLGPSSDSVLTPPVSGSAPGSGLGCESIFSDSNLGYGYRFNLDVGY
jgi:hypothetical protein